MLKNLGVQQLTKVDYHYLDVFFQKQGKASQKLNLARVHGLLTAIISAPTIIKPSDWINTLFRGDPAFDNVIEAEKVMGLLIELYSQISRQLKGDEPFFLLLWDENQCQTAEKCSEQVLKDWCEGYLNGTELDPLWGTDKSAVAMLTPFSILAKQTSFVGHYDNQGLIIEDDQCFIREYRTHLLDFVQDNYAYWLNEREADLFHKQASHQARERRNTLCPCESGLSFEECCYNAEATLH